MSQELIVTVADLPDIDPEVVRLCDAINRVPGLSTTESCCGHGVSSFEVYFQCDDTRQVWPLARSISPRYAGVPWVLEIRDCPDIPEPCSFVFHSGSRVGVHAYEMADDIASRIDSCVSDDRFKRFFRQN